MVKIKLLIISILVAVSWNPLLAQDDPTLLTCPKRETVYSYLYPYTEDTFPESETFYVSVLTVSERENTEGCSDVYEIAGNYLYGVVVNGEKEGDGWCDITSRSDKPFTTVYCEISLLPNEGIDIVIVNKPPTDALFPIRYIGSVKALWFQWPFAFWLPYGASTFKDDQ